MGVYSHEPTESAKTSLWVFVEVCLVQQVLDSDRKYFHYMYVVTVHLWFAFFPFGSSLSSAEIVPERIIYYSWRI